LRTLALPNRRPSTKPESRSGRDEQEAQLGWVLIQRCPKRVISGHFAESDRCPLYPQSGHLLSALGCPLSARS
jgi:hypothetical protein